MRWVVVGAGSAGCVVASRLAMAGDSEVVLLDAGSAESPAVESDSFFDALAEPGRTFDRLTATRVAGGVELPYRRGRGLGGSSAVNAMVALRGGPFDAAHLIPTELAGDGELGPVDRALLAAAPDARRAPLTRRHGRRVSAADAYLPMVPDDGRLAVHGDATVDRVVFERDRAVGVELADGRHVTADRVVLCAGSIHSPAILMRSGVDVPGLGDGLKDHPSAPLTLELRSDHVTDPSSLAVASLLERASTQVLPMNHLGPAALGYGLLLPALMRVRSTGRVRLRDLDPYVEPEVELGMLSDPADLDGLAAAVATALELLATPSFQAVVAAVYVDAHGTPASALDGPEAIRRWVPDHVGDYVHASCTCRMGVVVDDHGRVVGRRELFVCDASVLPDLPEVNTHLPVVMLAETLVARWIAGRSDAAPRGTPGA